MSPKSSKQSPKKRNSLIYIKLEEMEYPYPVGAKVRNGEFKKKARRSSKSNVSKEVTNIDESCTSALETNKNSLKVYIKKKENETSEFSTIKSGNEEYKEHLEMVLSNLYLNTVQRLNLNCPSLCAENLVYCFKHHYDTKAPDMRSNIGIESAFEEECFQTSILSLWDMCLRKVFPKDMILKKIIEFILSINPKPLNDVLLVDVYNNFCEVFIHIIRTFPPCYIALREYYLNLFKKSLNGKKITPQGESLPYKSDFIFDQLLELLENTMEQCSENMLNNIEITRIAKEDIETNKMDNVSNQWEYEACVAETQTFISLDLEIRLERLFMSLKLLLYLLEQDLVMWLLHNYRNPEKWIYGAQDRPIIVEVFKMNKFYHLTKTVQHFFKLFSIAINKNVHHSRLEILERYLALLMVASDAAEIEVADEYIKYPNLGQHTKNLIQEFFNIFKVYNETNICSYMTTIKLLRIPFVRYEFIDHFLQMFYHKFDMAMCPKKIYFILERLQHTRAYKCAKQLTVEQTEKMYVYLKVLLLALKAYSEFHGLQQFFKVLTNTQNFVAFSTVKNSYDTNFNADLEFVEANIEQLVKTFDTTAPQKKLKCEMHATIYVDTEICAKYYDDLKYVLTMKNLILQLANNAPKYTDISEWLEFLKNFDCEI